MPPSVFLILPVLLLLLLLFSLRISIEFIYSRDTVALTVKGSIMKHIKIFELKRGSGESGKKKWKTDKKESKYLHNEILSIYGSALRNQKGKILHIEKLDLKGTFSLEDAAANAVLYGIFLTLWQFLLIFLSSNFSLEHQRYHFLPDFHHNRNELIFHAIFRVVIVKILWLLTWGLIEHRRTRKKFSSQTV